MRVIEGRDERILGHEHLRFDFTGRGDLPEVLVTMHQFENFNNIEVLKFALMCRRKGVRITAYGMLNQLPLFGIFADSAILQVNPSWSKNVYPRDGDDHSTTYETFDLFGELADDFDMAFNLSRPPGPPESWPSFLREPEYEITDQEVAREFLCPDLFVREQALEAYRGMAKDGFIGRDTIMCEVKINSACGGRHLLDIFRKKTEGYEIPVCHDQGYRRELCRRSGMDLMSVQALSSLDSNWMWISYGGASNILPFFPIKILSLSDAYVRPELTRALFSGRYGPFGDVFPEFETLIFCFPGEEDGPSRTDGHRPLPDMRKFVREFSKYELGCEI